MRIVTASVVLAIMLTSGAQAASAKAAPRLYRVDGRPVPVSCLEALTSPEEDALKAPIDLRSCGDPNLKPRTQADGSVGYNIPDGGYFYYAYVGRSDGVDILLLQSSGGGSGHFTQLVGVTHSGYFVSWARDYGGGDRCNGGLSDEKVSNGRLTFDQAITPYDLIKLAEPETKLEAYKDLEASAASCIGVSHMTDDDKSWTGVSLTEKDWADQKGWTEQYQYEACFNKLYSKAVSTGHGELDRRGVQTFARTFTDRCVQAH